MNNAKATLEKNEEWLSIPERGSVWGMYILMRSATLFGRWLPRTFLWPIAAYYFLLSRKTRDASRTAQTKIRGRTPSQKEIFINILRFSQVALDRLFFTVGKNENFQFQRNGTEYLEAHMKANEGALLLGAHVGSFSAMRGGGNAKDYKINAMVYGANSKIINGVLEKFGRSVLRTIDISRDRISGMLKVSEGVEKGEFVAILIDRVLPKAPFAEVDFLGGKAKISTGGFSLAALVKCPVYLVFGIYRGGNRYELHCEPFADRIILPRGKAKKKELDLLAQRYADRLAEYAKQAPDNWFNFFDFWETSGVKDIDVKEASTHQVEVGIE